MSGGGYIYCLYSTHDGVPRYVGHADQKVSYRFKQHVSAALEMESGEVYDWMRDVWRQNSDVAVFTLQEGIPPGDRAFFEGYWIDQFAGLLNVMGNHRPQQHTRIAEEVITSIRRQLELVKQGPRG